VDLTHPPSNSDEKYLSRYIDEQNSPQFPFGYGLSYSSFRYGATEVSGNKLQTSTLNQDLNGGSAEPKPVLSASAEITNTGSRPAEEVVQLYVRLQGTSVAQPVRALKGFQRVSLAPGECKKVTFPLGPQAFALWNDQNRFAVESARATIWISPDSAEGSGVVVEILP